MVLAFCWPFNPCRRKAQACFSFADTRDDSRSSSSIPAVPSGATKTWAPGPFPRASACPAKTRSTPHDASFMKKRVSRWPGRLSCFRRSGRLAGRPCTHGRSKRTSIRRGLSATPSRWSGRRAAAVSRHFRRSTVRRGSPWRKRVSRSCRARCHCSSRFGTGIPTTAVDLRTPLRQESSRAFGLAEG